MGPMRSLVLVLLLVLLGLLAAGLCGSSLPSSSLLASMLLISRLLTSAALSARVPAWRHWCMREGSDRPLMTLKVWGTAVVTPSAGSLKPRQRMAVCVCVF